MSRREITRKEMMHSARTASDKAVKQAKTSKTPYTVQEGRQIIKHYPNGGSETVGELSKAYVVVSKKTYSLA